MSKTYYVTFGTGDPRQFTGLSPTFLTFNNAGTTVTPPSIAEVTGATGFYSFAWGTTTPIAFLIDAATTSPGTAGRYVKGSIDPADRADEYGTTMIAIGTSHIAQGVSLFALGATNVALGTTNVALGTSNIALGVTNVAIGTSHIAQGVSILAFGTSLISFGNSSIAQGVSILAFGSTLTGFGTSIYAGQSGIVNMGVTLVGIGNTVSGIGLTVGNLGGLIGSTASSYGSTSTDPSTIFGFLIRAQEFREGNSTYTKATGILDFYSRGSSTLLREKTISDSSTTTTKT